MPSISKAGSGSAYPSFCANAKVGANSLPSSILDKIKFEVPFNMPEIFEMLFAANSSLRSFITGVPAHTADSKRTLTPFLFAMLNISSP